MIINIRVTDAAIKYLKRDLLVDEERAGEVAQMVVSLCNISARPDPGELKEVGYQVRVSARDLIAHIRRSGLREVDRMETLSRIHILERALEEEGEGSDKEDRLYKAADSLMRYYAEEGSNAFRTRFGSLDILKACEKVISEGEGNPHPWE